MIEEPFGEALPSVALNPPPLSLVVAQIRFPIVASINDEGFIGPFQERIRTTYADLRRDVETQVVIGPEGVRATEAGVVWRFSDGADGWEVALTTDFLALATNNYTNRADFMTRLTALAVALGEWLHPQRIRRLGVRYIDRIGEPHLGRVSDLLRPEVLGPANAPRPDAVTIHHALTDCEYRFPDETALRARWGFLEPKTTFDPAIEPADDKSWVLDLDASHGERAFSPESIRKETQLFSDRIYRYFRWAVTDDFLRTFGGQI